jgi:hypothetical protein
LSYAASFCLTLYALVAAFLWTYMQRDFLPNAQIPREFIGSDDVYRRTLRRVGFVLCLLWLPSVVIFGLLRWRKS